MFEGLKKKFSSFVSGLTKKEEEKMHDAPSEEQKFGKPAPEVLNKHEEVRAKPQPQPKPKAHEILQQEAEVRPVPDLKEKPVKQHVSIKQEATDSSHPAQKQDSGYAKEELRDKPLSEQREESRTANEDIVIKDPVRAPPAVKAPEVRERPRVTTTTKIKGIFLREIRVKDEDIEPFMEELRTSLLQSDVNYDAAEKILEGIRKGLVGKQLTSRNAEQQISSAIRQSIMDILGKKERVDLLAVARQKKASGELPLKVLFIGPNGAGKTTTMAKVANLFIKNGFSCVLSASDTFRAAAIEQTAIHANRLGIGVIKGRYGADPASIAFDAIAHAKAHGIDVVLIDSAGRQETNKSLMDEVKKMVRVAKPDVKVFVGESIAGNTLLNQVHEFNTALGLDGVILTKLDCDAKGGNTLSIISEADVPVIYFGLGEGYDDLMPFSPEFILNNIVQNN